MVVRAYLPRPSSALLMTGPGPGRHCWKSYGSRPSRFWACAKHDPARRGVGAGRRRAHPAGDRH
eukprot:106624-Prymnesium_polylepis.1